MVEEVTADIKEVAQDMESRIKSAMWSRVGYFKEKADSLTLEGVRRLLEKDLELEKYDLDVYKRFIKESMEECIEEAGNVNVSKTAVGTVEKNACSAGDEATEIQAPEALQSKEDVKEPNSGDEDKVEGSPVLGLLTGKKTKKYESEEPQSIVSESMMRKAIRRRAAYFKANSEKVTMAGVRRLLEKDLKLEKNTLDHYKDYIRDQVDEIFASLEVSKSQEQVKGKVPKRSPQSKPAEKVSSEDSSDSSEAEDEESKKARSRKRAALKKNPEDTGRHKKRKILTKESVGASKKRIKPADEKSNDSSGVEDNGNVSEDDRPQSSTERPTKKKEVAAPVYGKRVENLKSVIRSCGMSIPPSIYKRAKQAPENNREACLIKELEGILSREGLSANPSEKEIKDVKRRKERAKELEGIDLSNIVSSSRRRSTTSFMALPKPKIPVKSDSEEENSDNEDESDDADEDNEVGDENVDNGAAADDSESDEVVEDDEDSD